MKDTYTIAIAGSTQRTVQIAQELFQNAAFHINWVLTPKSKKIGRNQTVTKNPLHRFAIDNKIETILVDAKINTEIQKEISEKEQSDFLLVVDFGFLIPGWLLDFPQIAPINIHPSLLPRWRGSSPGQFALLHGEKESAVTIMVMNSQLDQGPILAQIPFSVPENWTQTEYYQQSFDLATQNLASTLQAFAQGKITPQPQPETSPTPTARRLSKQDSFIEWEIVKKLMAGEKTTAQLSADSASVLNSLPATAKNFSHACRAFFPWPKLWTIVPTPKSEKRLIIHACSQDKNTLKLELVQLEGKQPSTWEQIHTALLL